MIKTKHKYAIVGILDTTAFYGILSAMAIVAGLSIKEYFLQNYGENFYEINIYILLLLLSACFGIFIDLRYNHMPIVDFLIEHNLFKFLPFWLAEERLSRPEAEMIYGNCGLVKKAKSLFETKKSAESAKFFLQIVREYDCSHLHSSEMDKAIEEAYSINHKAIMENIDG